MISALLPLILVAIGSPTNLLQNSDFALTASPNVLAHYELVGKVHYGKAGYVDEYAGMGVSLDSFSSGPPSAGSVSQLVVVDPKRGKWVNFRVRGRAEDGFQLSDEQLYLKLDFYSQNGTKYQDTAKRLIWREIVQDRKNLAVNGDNHKTGAAVWRSYQFEERLPFAETDAVKVTLGFQGGKGTDRNYSRFYATDFEVTQSEFSTSGLADPISISRTRPQGEAASLIPLGGRWYYAPAPGESASKHLIVNAKNADRLLYKDIGFSTPFAGNMDSYLQPGFLDEKRQIVTKTTYVPDNVWIEFDGSETWTLHSKDIPNHPIAKFPDTYGTQGYNPNYVMAHNNVYRLPINPVRNPNAVALPASHANTGALHMGPIGFAVNGVQFFNPFDAGSADATGIMDRCCGHPSPDYSYHYHKYPICVNTPFVDKGEDHSPLIGFAFDGFPVCGPYESKGVLAKDSLDHKLDAFNAHYDPNRGWHYHVTPGQFPYIIGGFMGQEPSGFR